MQLTFEINQNLGLGSQPQAIHTPENVIQIIFVDDGKIYAKDAETPLGEWESRVFNPAYLISTDIDIEHMKLKYVSSESIFVVWKNPTEDGETVPHDPDVTHSVRHRLAVWALRQNLTKYLVDGDLEFRQDDPVAKINIEFENPNYSVSNEDDTLLTPGTSLTLFFRSGDSSPLPMGRYFIDRNSMGVTESSTSVDGRNSIGKLLRDQTFDEDNVFPSQNLQQTFEAVLDSFGVTNYWVGNASFDVGMEFPPSMNGYEGMLELLKTVRKWKIGEEMNGTIGIGFTTDNRFTQPSTYTFYRDKDVFSRSVTRDDFEAYSRVCVNDGTEHVYRDVDFRFVMPRKKTLYISVAEGTALADMEAYADELAELFGSVGIIETFVGPFRPQLIVGDQARIISNNVKLLGLITTIRHKFGKSGFYTEFTVDAGGRIGRERISNYIEKLRERTGQAKRVY